MQENIAGTTGGEVVVITLCYYLPLRFSSIPDGIYMLGRAQNAAFETDPVCFCLLLLADDGPISSFEGRFIERAPTLSNSSVLRAISDVEDHAVICQLRASRVSRPDSFDAFLACRLIDFPPPL